MTKNEETILNNLVKTLQDYENECYRQMAFMNEHKFEMEHEAIRITAIKVERLQDITDEDCLKEGVSKMYHAGGGFLCYRCSASDLFYHTPQEAFSALIDRISGKGTWLRNPWVFAYEFELIKKEDKQ